MKFLRKLIRLVAIGLVIAAVVDQLRRPSDDRTWFGRVAGLVPYDFRRPTVSRIKNQMWNPRDDRVFTETAFGVGWTINLPTLREKLLERSAA